jgi:hypothetical protein
MPLAGFESTAPVFERAKTVHALDRAATVIGTEIIYPSRIMSHHFKELMLRLVFDFIKVSDRNKIFF